MRYYLLIAAFIILSGFRSFGQDDSIPSLTDAESVLTATLKAKNISVDLSNPEELKITLQKIHTYKYLESIVLEGEIDEEYLSKIFVRLSNLKNLSEIVLRGNEIKKVPGNISSLRSLKSITIDDNKEVDYTDLCATLKNTSVSQLNLIDDDIKKTPSTVSQITTLKKIQISGSDRLDYTDLIDQLAKLPALNSLSIPVNYISELPKNIDKLKSLQVLDVSNNALTELPGEISSLKAINNLSIQGNLLLNTASDLEKLKGSNIQYLSLDKEISGSELERIKEMFPNAQIDFPLDKEENPDQSEEEKTKNAAKMPPPVPQVHTGELKAQRQNTILSAAYLSYPAYFRGVTYNFDTLNFEERYNNLTYSNVYRNLQSNTWVGGAFHFRKTTLNYERPGKKNETWFRFGMNEQTTAFNYPELRAFEGMYWVYAGELTKKEFEKKYLFKKRGIALFNFLRFKRKRLKAIPLLWSDIRLDFDKNNSMFTITLKTPKGFEQFTAYPVLPNVAIEKSQQTYNRRFLLYQKSLLRRSQNFKRDLLRNRNKYDSNYKKLKEYAWKTLQSGMSDEEKEMTMDEWLNYYDGIVANEQNAIDNTSLASNYILRDLVLRGYSSDLNTNNPMRKPPPTAVNYKLKTIGVDFYDSKGGGKLAVSNIFILDNKDKFVDQVTGTLGISSNMITIEQFASVSILVELRNGNWGLVSSEEIDKQSFLPNKTCRLQTLVFDKNLDTVGNLLKEALTK